MWGEWGTYTLYKVNIDSTWVLGIKCVDKVNRKSTTYAGIVIVIVWDSQGDKQVLDLHKNFKHFIEIIIMVSVYLFYVLCTEGAGV